MLPMQRVWDASLPMQGVWDPSPFQSLGVWDPSPASYMPSNAAKKLKKKKKKTSYVGCFPFSKLELTGVDVALPPCQSDVSETSGVQALVT